MNDRPQEPQRALPPVTGLSSAFPMEMEPRETPRPLAPGRQDPQDPAAREPHRHPPKN